MTLFRFDIGASGRRAGRFIGLVRDEILKALDEERRLAGLTQQGLAEKLDVPRSQINRQLAGERSLSLRSVAEIAGALDREIVFELRPKTAHAGQNFVSDTSTIGGHQILMHGGSSGESSTLPRSLHTDHVVSSGMNLE